MNDIAIGSLVRTRGREWVVLPESEGDLLILRPLGGSDEEIAGVLRTLEDVEPATFGMPDPGQLGDYRSCRLLRDAVRISTRAGAGPFRSLAKIAVQPRPYQIVPLLMALRQDPVRLLIADDVGIGKTIEASLIAREFLDRGEISRMAVLCPPHLAEQWQKELEDKFHIDAELVLANTAGRLERRCGVGQSLFDIYPRVIVSMDFIKSDRRREDFVRACPEFVIVDEAHTCAAANGRGKGRQQRHELLKKLAANEERHMVFVTATPHSGKEEAFRSILTFLHPSFIDLPEDLSGRGNEARRKELAKYFVQRRRADIRHFMQEDTPFPEREEAESTYQLSAEYLALFKDVLEYAREQVADESGGKHRQRVRWWSVLALLRSLASSPAAAAQTLKNRSAVADCENVSDIDELGRRTVFDEDSDSLEDVTDVVPGSHPGEEAQRDDRRLRQLAKQASGLMGEKDQKLLQSVKLIKGLLSDDFTPIVFCRFIPTVDYVTSFLRGKLKGVEVMPVTGKLAPVEREARIQELTEKKVAGSKVVLVCTDCLSEGINLQEHFDAVVHYDLSWSPTRHEQREGRVDRYGQPKKVVRVMTYYGTDNMIDGVVLDVLLRKHKAIRRSLGVSVPVPGDTNQLIEAVFEGMVLREQASGDAGQGHFPEFDDYLKRSRKNLHDQWQNATEREKRSRTLFAQETIKAEEVKPELNAARQLMGAPESVQRFVVEGFEVHGGTVAEHRGIYNFDTGGVRPKAILDAIGLDLPFVASFTMPAPDNALVLSRTHPVVEGLANFIVDTALDTQQESQAARSGVIRTDGVQTRTTALLCRFRFHLTTKRGKHESTQLAEECVVLAFEGSPGSPEWLCGARAEALLELQPTENVALDRARSFVERVTGDFARIQAELDETAAGRAQELLSAHQRVRTASKIRGVKYEVRAQQPIDVLGVFVYLPNS